MARFSFEICSVQQVDELVEYIDTNWVKNHVFVRSRELLDWQHKSKTGDFYNFIMARHNKTGDICGVLGFIPTSHYSSELESEKEAWLAIWKVTEGPKYIGLGLGLLNFLKKSFSIENICSIGISPIVYPMYQTLGYNVNHLSQMAIVNTEIINHSISVIPKNFICNNLLWRSDYQVEFISNDSFIAQNLPRNFFNNKTKKNNEYFINRYIQHPKYHYRFLGVYQANVLVAFMVLRTVHCNESSALRVLDIQGEIESLAHISGRLYDLIVKEGHEYIDIMQFGMNEENLLAAGYINVSHHEGLVIPDYFQPFVQDNIKISFARKTKVAEESFVLFKGDSDQDRPNIM